MLSALHLPLHRCTKAWKITFRTCTQIGARNMLTGRNAYGHRAATLLANGLHSRQRFFAHRTRWPRRWWWCCSVLHFRIFAIRCHWHCFVTRIAGCCCCCSRRSNVTRCLAHDGLDFLRIFWIDLRTIFGAHQLGSMLVSGGREAGSLAFDNGGRENRYDVCVAASIATGFTGFIRKLKESNVGLLSVKMCPFQIVTKYWNHYPKGKCSAYHLSCCDIAVVIQNRRPSQNSGIIRIRVN